MLVTSYSNSLRRIILRDEPVMHAFNSLVFYISASNAVTHIAAR